MTACAHFRFRILLLAPWLLSATSVVARAADGATSEKSPPAKSESPATEAATKAADAKPDAAAQHRSEEEYFELFRSLADTVDQVDRNYVKPIDRREIME